MTRTRIGVALFAAGNALLLAAFAAGGLTTSEWDFFGWRQRAA